MAKYDINIRDYWRIIRKRRTVVILSAILFTVFSYLFAVIRTPEPLYEATSAVKVEKATDLTTLLLGTVSWTSWDNVATQAVIITSFPVFEESARQMGLIPENVSSAQVRSTDKYLQIVSGLKSQIATEQEGNTNIINITATSSSATDAALLANTVAEVYRQTNVNERNKKIRETREFIEKQLEVVESRLQQAEQKLRNYERSTKLVAIDAQTTAVIDRLISLENEVANLQQKRLEAKRQLGLLQKFLEGKQSVSHEAFYVEDSSHQLAKLTAKFRDLSLRREVLLNDYTEEHPAVGAVDAKLANVLSEMDKELRSMLTTMDGRLQDLEKRLEAARDQAMAIPDSVLILARLRREVEVNGDLLAQLKGKYQEVMIQESGLIEEVKIVKPALEPSYPINMPNTLMNTVTGGIIGLVVGLVLALIVETMDTSLGTIEDVEEILGIPVLGVIPSVEEFASSEKDETLVRPRGEPLVTHFAPRSPVSEAYRSLRTNLQFISTDKKAKAYLITSSSLQEGKTYNVVNLSLSLAQAGEKVLLIDADLRRPTVHHIFGLQRQPGLTDYVVGTSELGPKPENTVELNMTLTFNSGQTENGWKDVTNNIVDLMLGEFGIDDILRTPGMDNLHIINAGQGLLNPAEILRSPRFKEFLREVREHYDIIIVDTPPVLPVADAFEVAPEVDGVILVYEVGRIGRGILKRAKVQLENINTEVLGVILNNVKPDVAPDFYRYRTDYYYRSEDSDEISEPPSRWREFVDQPLRIFQNIMRSSPEAKRKRTIVPLFLIVGILAIAGLLWQSYPKIKSAFQSRLDQKEFSTRERPQQKTIVPASVTKRTESESSELSPARESLKTSSIETVSQGQIPEQTGSKPGQPNVSQPPSKEDIEPAAQTVEEQPSVQKKAIAPIPVTEDKVIAEKEPAKTKVKSAEASIGNFVEKWRRSWEEGDVQTYIGCYHSSFTARGMDIQAWKNYKQDIFNRTVERKVQLSDINIELDGSIATVTFKQRYETKNYRGYGLKTLQLTNYRGNWSILDESYESLPAAVEPTDAAIQRFVEHWRRAWEEGDLEIYTGCYHPDFKIGNMTTQEWKIYKQNLFSSTATRKVQINDIKIQANDASAVVTFKQRYQAAKHRDVGIKTLHLRRHEDRWNILEENWKPLSGQG
ncbi:MAG: AAA family ATPase [Syntrophobacterales bacterium]|jgi:capsular exopolysaccharide synthesis family protein